MLWFDVILKKIGVALFEIIQFILGKLLIRLCKKNLFKSSYLVQKLLLRPQSCNQVFVLIYIGTYLFIKMEEEILGIEIADQHLLYRDGSRSTNIFSVQGIEKLGKKL